MLDLRAISRDPEPTRAALARRRDGSDERLTAALELRARLNALRPELEQAQAERNAGAKAIGEAKRSGADASEAIAAMQAVSARVKELEPEVARLDEELSVLVATLPNPPDPSAADEDNVLREWGVGSNLAHP
ncbi:MAG TPA: serine--tRNA ligase, partial [Solirubrobacter sp.]|nr:serine--tRNA ligase [Solirubrobacter sp.]